MTAYTIWNQVSQSATNFGWTGTLATEFHLSSDEALTGIWWWSPSGTNLPTQIAIYDFDSSTLVSGTQNNSPSWSGAAGSGWVKCSYDGSVTLNSGVNYAVAAYVSGTASYETASFPITNGPLTGTASLYSTTSGGISFPGSGSGNTFLTDVEVSSGGTPHTATVTLALSPSFTVDASRGHSRTVALALSPSFTVDASRGHSRTVALPLAPSVAVARAQGHVRTVTLPLAPSFKVVPSGGVPRVHRGVPDSDESREWKRLLFWDDL